MAVHIEYDGAQFRGLQVCGAGWECRGLLRFLTGGQMAMHIEYDGAQFRGLQVCVWREGGTALRLGLRVCGGGRWGRDVLVRDMEADLCSQSVGWACQLGRLRSGGCRSVQVCAGGNGERRRVEGSGRHRV